MLSSIQNSAGLDLAAVQSSAPRTAKPSEKVLEEQKTFQKFAAGTFYQTMLKSLRSTERETKYFNGGRAEKIFRAEFDQHVAATMAEEHGGPLSEPLFNQFTAMTRQKLVNAQNKNTGQMVNPKTRDTAAPAAAINGASS